MIKRIALVGASSTGKTTVFELLKNFEKISGVAIKFKYLPRLDGDLDSFLADSSKAFKKMNWQPERNIKNICEDTWR